MPAAPETPAEALARKLALIERIRAENTADYWPLRFVAMVERDETPQREREAA